MATWLHSSRWWRWRERKGGEWRSDKESGDVVYIWWLRSAESGRVWL